MWRRYVQRIVLFVVDMHDTSTREKTREVWNLAAQSKCTTQQHLTPDRPNPIGEGLLRVFQGVSVLRVQVTLWPVLVVCCSTR